MAIRLQPHHVMALVRMGHGDVRFSDLGELERRAHKVRISEGGTVYVETLPGRKVGHAYHLPQPQ